MSKSRTGSTSPSTCVISLSSKVPEKLKKPNFKCELKNTKRIISYFIFFDREHNTCGQHNTRAV